MPMASSIVQSEDFQAFCSIKEEKPRSETPEPKGHFIDSISINPSFTCDDSNECLHEYDISFIDELPTESALRIENALRRKDIDLLRRTRASLECFTFLPHDNNHDQGSFYPILSCDLTPDIKKLCSIEYDLFKFAFGLSDYVSNLSWGPRHINDSMHETLSCNLPRDILKHKPLHLVYMISFDCINAVSGLFWQKLDGIGFQGSQQQPYILGPPPIDPEPPPKKDGERPQATLLKFMILIQDENFCFKSLRRSNEEICQISELSKKDQQPELQ